MGDEGNDRRSDVRAKPVEPQADAGAYSSNDLSHFAQLSNFSSLSSTRVDTPPASGAAPLDEPVTDYTNEDTQAFARLMDDLGRMPRAKGVAARVDVTQSRGAYTDRDIEQFARLMPADRSFEVSEQSAAKPAGPSDDPTEAVSYSAADIEAFRRIMPDGVEEPANEAHASGAYSRPADANVGPIRIVDFGEQQTRSRQRARAEEVAIKVRYFD